MPSQQNTPRPGNYVCVRTGGWLAWLIRRACHSGVNHAFLVVDDNGGIIEARPEGVRAGNLSEYAGCLAVANTAEAADGEPRMIFERADTTSWRIERGMHCDPSQIPAALKEPAMDAGHPPENGAPITPLPGAHAAARMEYDSVRKADLDPADPGAVPEAIGNMAAHGWRLAAFDGERYIFERPWRDGSEPRER